MKRVGLSAALAVALALGCDGGADATVEKLDPTGTSATPDPAHEPQAPSQEPAHEPAPDAPPPDLPQEEGPPPDGPRASQIESGESLAKILRREGLDAQQRHKLLEALSEHTDPAKVRIGQSYELVYGNGQLIAFRLDLDKLTRVDVSQVEYGWSADLVKREFERGEVAYQGEIEGSLWKSLENAGASPKLVAVFVDAFAFDLNFYTDTRKGDRFAVLVSERRADGEFIEYERVLAARYQGSKATHEVYWWQPDPKKPGGYFDAEGKGIKRTFLKSPLKFSRISSGFSAKRMHPVLHREKGHMGTDYAAPTGTPVWAASDGKIVFRGDKGGAGNMVIIRHDNGLKTLYMHLSKFEKGQKVGQRVEQKQVIGYVGMTGLATGPHLHFGVQRGGRYVDPQSVDMQRDKGVPKSQLRKFKKQVQSYRNAWTDAGATPDASDEPSN